MENNKIFWRKVPSVTNLLLCGMFIPVGILHASESYGQRVMIDLTAENMTVKEVLEQIESQSDFDFFYNNASSFGEFGILNFALRLFGRPMTPGEMGRTMPIASNGKIWINPALCFADLFAYDQIKHYKKPAIRLCGSGGQLHWTLAYGAKQTGSWLWRNYYFLQIDNGAKVGVPGDKKNGGNYTKVDWWNPWLMVWD